MRSKWYERMLSCMRWLLCRWTGNIQPLDQQARQTVNNAPACLLRQVRPTLLLFEQRQLIGVLPPVLHGILRRRGQDKTKTSEHCAGGRSRQAGSSKQPHQLQQTCQRTARIESQGQGSTAIGIGHPHGDRQAVFLQLDLDLVSPAQSMPPEHRQFTAKKGVQCIVDRHFARIAGIIGASLKGRRTGKSISAARPITQLQRA